MFDRRRSRPTCARPMGLPVSAPLLLILMNAEGRAASGHPDWSEAVVEPVDRAVTAVSDGLLARLDRIAAAGGDLNLVRSTLAAAGWSPMQLLAAIAAVVAAGLAADRGTAYALGRAGGRGSWIARCGLPAAAALGAGLAVAAVVSGEAEAARRTLRTWALVVPLAGLAASLIRAAIVEKSAAPRCKRLVPLARGLSTAVAWALAGIALLRTLALWEAGSGLRDLVGTALVAVPTAGLIAGAYARAGRPLAAALAGPRPRSGGRRVLARCWPVIAVAVVAVTILASQVATTLGRPLPPLAILVTLVLVLIWPHLDRRIAAWAERGFRVETVSAAAVAARRTARMALAAVIGAALAALWGAPAALGLGIRLDTLARTMAEIAAVALATAYLWNGIGVATGRVLAEERGARDSGGDEAEEAPRTRLGTILPLLAGAAKAGLAALAVLSVLLALGINVWPLVTGLSVFGLALGFGSQSLVKDVVSGLFFLADDAFRLGEYIETAGAKGSVEKISIRSVSLRHPRGALATIPYGQIGKVQNYSRDWVIEKLAFRVAFDTDVETVRRLFKQIGKDLEADPELRPDLLEPFKSQGIAAVEDGTLVIRGKFKARAGRQFGIRRAVLAAVQRAFHDNGIVAVAHPTLMPGARSMAGGQGLH
ncbi:mechanosensitive ion channel family protein [Methylobacterium currus]|uniref:mechanosensitive ion channel family protein n=1 Tax=Methylobacterium currus TaxID=2051553 RepID=UPI001E284122|nr:mechanosensitive ion channel family protein [Methylobacterium currus]UHC17099.1 mechanosensitive ion channel family protein [Methylobacterium currus]